MSHQFIFEPGTWLGEGTIHFRSSPEEIKFYTKWQIKLDEGVIHLNHSVEMHRIDHRTVSSYTLSNIRKNSFEIELTNETVTKIKGHGSITEEEISWKFHIPGIYEGFESYTMNTVHLYSFHAEYHGEELYLTIIDGIIWKKE